MFQAIKQEYDEMVTSPVSREHQLFTDTDLANTKVWNDVMKT